LAVTRARRSLIGLLAVALAVGGCAGDDASDDDVPSLGADILAAVAAVEAERGAGQEYFEVTAAALVTNVFVAVDGATAAVPYAFIDGELLSPEPRLDGASGFTFTADAIEFDADAVLSQVAEELPDATIESLSVEGGDGGVVRYVTIVRSDAGGLLEVTVGPDGAVLGVDPL
jgi:hypothetical protein